ncbi:MAG: PqqD family protein [Oscillospiraceae bacterium]|jgi:hypothetical protein|nr:PqqD family protein [Oscillospiraceae bacterium]
MDNEQQNENQRYLRMVSIEMKLKPGFVLRKVGQAYMVMPTGPRMKEYQGMITLNETGAFLFKEISKPDQTPETLKEACIKEYGATEEEAKKAVDLFVRQCANCGLLPVTARYFDTVEQREVTPDEFR